MLIVDSQIHIWKNNKPGNPRHRQISDFTADKVHMFDAYGPQRLFWDTDITRMPCSWRQCITLFTEDLPWFKGRDLELVMGRAVCDWLGGRR